MKVAIVRGPSLNPWEMQTYEEMASEVELLGVGSKWGKYDVTKIGFGIERLLCVGEYLSFIPGGISFLYRYMGDTQYLIDFDRYIEGFDIVHTAELGSYYSLQAVRAKEKGLIGSVTLTVFENIPYQGDEIPVRKRLKEEVRNGVDHFFAATTGAKEALVLEGADSNRISILGPGVETKRFSGKLDTNKAKFRKIRRDYGFGRDDFVVLSVGRMVWEKGFYDVLRCARRIKNGKDQTSRKRKIKFLLVGEGSEKLKLEKFMERLELGDSVSFVGEVSYKAMPEVFGIADVFVLASLQTQTWKEQYGMVLIEAMASELPIIGTLSGATSLTVGKGGGIFVQPQDFVSLADAIKLLYSDSKLRKKMGSRNRRVAEEKYDNKVVAKSIRKVWEKVLEDSK